MSVQNFVPPSSAMIFYKRAAERLFGYFPRTAASDPEVFTVGLLQLLSAYPQTIVEAMLSPISGIPAKHQFLPSIAEIRGWLEDHTPKERAVNRALVLAIPDMRRDDRETVEQLQGRYGEDWGLSAKRPKRGLASWVKTVDELKWMGNLTQEHWDAMPKQGDPPTFKRK